MNILQKNIQETVANTLTVLVLMFASLALVGVPVGAAPKDDACAGIRAAGGTCSPSGADRGFSNIVTSIVDVLSIVVGAVAVVMIIIGGFRYIISAGDQNGVTGAKNTILYAIVGLVIVLFAQIIVRFVLTNATR